MANGPPQPDTDPNRRSLPQADLETPGQQHVPMYHQETYDPIPGQTQPCYHQAEPPAAMVSQQSTVIVINQRNTQPDVVVVDEKDNVTDCGGVDCTCCPDNRCGSCCRQFWICETGHNWYSLSGKSAGWIIVLLVVYIVFGALIACVALCALILCALGCGTGDDS
ncbi:uncharacterized protein [Ptychodera flava]|uniref:uncharacterized protein n=1 Tax=Ptychodera flava TaxID=63121 RepID=UPI00396AA9B1